MKGIDAMAKNIQRRQPRSRQSARKVAEQRAARQRRRRLLGGTVIGALLVVAILIALNRPSTSTLSSFGNIAIAAPLDSGLTMDGLVLGKAEAPVTVVEWGDYQCPHCGTFNQDIAPQLIADYVATGKVRFEYRNLAFLGDESIQAAEAAMCANDQGSFWRYHDTLFANQHGENQGAFANDRLKDMAKQLSLDTDQFNTCLDEGTHEDEVKATRQEASAAGITSTPTIVVNGVMVPFRSYDDLKAAIEASLP
jgi:protein-disulfide isomerase